MNIPQGYKQTELGIIPEDWEYSPSQKYLKEISMGPFGSDIKVENFVGFGIPVLNGANLQSYRLIDRFENYVTSQKAAALKKAVANKGDIIITHRGTLGQVTYIPKSAKFDRYVISQSQFRVRFNECIDSEFIVRYLLSPIGQECLLEFKGHTGVPALAQPTTNFRNLPLLIPPIAEQRAIAEALSDEDGLIAALDKKIANKRLLKQGAMQQLLTGRKRLPGFTDEWKYVALEHLLEYEQPTKYLVQSTDYIESGTPVLTAGKTFILGYTAETKGIYTNLPVIIFDDFTTDSKYVTMPFKAKSSAMKMLQLKDRRYNLRLVYELMQLIQFPLYDHQRYWISEYSKLQVYIPSDFKEQQAIATILSDMDKEIADLEAQRDKYRLLKSGMMQKLLTGQIRLKRE